MSKVEHDDDAGNVGRDLRGALAALPQGRPRKLSAAKIVDLVVRVNLALEEHVGDEVDEATREDAMTLISVAMFGLFAGPAEREWLRRTASAASGHNQTSMWGDLEFTATLLLKHADSAEMLALFAASWLASVRTADGSRLKVDTSKVVQAVLDASKRRQGARTLAVAIAKLAGIHATPRAVKAAAARSRARR